MNKNSLTLEEALAVIESLEDELNQIKLAAFRIEIERDAISELHKQVIMEVLNEKNQTSAD